MSNIFWAAATIGLDKQEIQPIVAALVGRMRTDAGKFNEQDLSNVFWAAAAICVDTQEIQPIVTAVV
eukprot:6309950-Amphidinium_carterae.1